jgi:hypothetical protein
LLRLGHVGGLSFRRNIDLLERWQIGDGDLSRPDFLAFSPLSKLQAQHLFWLFKCS